MGSVTCGIATSTINCMCCACPWGSSAVSKYIYTVMLLASLGLSYLWNGYARAPFNYPSFPPAGSSELIARYYGPWAIATGLGLFHGLLAVLLFGVRKLDDPRGIVQNGWWPPKILLLLIAILSGFLMPLPVFQYFYYMAVIASIVFLTLQSVFLVDFAYRGAELLVEKYEESEGPLWKYVLFGVTGLLYIVSIIFNVVIGHRFSGLVPFAIVNGLLIVVVTVCSVLEVVQEANSQAGIFQAAFVSFYNTYLLVASTAESPESNNIPGWQTSIYLTSAVLFIIGMFYYASSIGEKQDDGGDGEEDVEKGLKSSHQEKTAAEYSVSLFHIFFIMATLYGTMMILKWKWATVTDGGDFELQYSKVNFAFWSRIISSWSLSGLYLWSLFAPLVFPDRDFS